MLVLRLLLRLVILSFFLSGLYSCTTVLKNTNPESIFQQGLNEADKALAAQDFVAAESVMKALNEKSNQATPEELAHADIILSLIHI